MATHAPHAPARSHLDARAAADAFATLWGDEQDPDLDLTRVDRMAGNDRSTEPMTVDELNGEEEASLDWDDLPTPAPAPAPTTSAKKAGKQPARPQQQQPAKKSPAPSISKSPPPRTGPKPPPRARTTTRAPSASESESKSPPLGAGRPSTLMVASDDEDTDDAGAPLAKALVEPAATPNDDDEVDEVGEDWDWDAEMEQQQPEDPKLAPPKPKPKKIAAAGPRGLQGKDARPVVSNLSDSDDNEWDALPTRRAAPIGEDELCLSSDNEEEREGEGEGTPAKRGGGGGGVAFTGSVPARPTVDMTPKTMHAAKLLEQMMPLGTGAFGKQTREQRLLAAPRGRTETVRGVLGTTEEHPRGPRAEQQLALKVAIDTPGAVQLFEAKYNHQRQETAQAKYVMRREELIANAAERKAERMKQHDVTLKACDMYKRAQADRVANAQRAQEAGRKPQQQ